MDKALVSVIMPAFNAEEFIEEAIDSVLKQTYTNWELLIIDDGSTDKTSEIIKARIAEDNRIKYFYQPNGKQGKARNLGIKNSTGFWLAFIDADDMWVAQKLEIQLNIISNASVDLIFSQGYLITTENSITDFNVKVKSWNKNTDIDTLIIQNQIPILSVLVRKEAVLESRSFNEETSIQNAEDYHLWLKMLAKGYQFLSVADRLFYYRLHEHQSTHNNQNLDIPIIFVFKDLVLNKIIDTNNTTVINRVKWFVFNYPNFFYFVSAMKIIYPAKNFILNLIKLVYFFVPESYARKMVFQLL